MNAWLTLADPTAAEAVAAAGYDAVTVDLQHGSATLEDLPAILAAVEQTPAVPLVRLRWNDPGTTMRALDLGVRGAICPMVGSRAEADAFVAACRYPPDGWRSYGPIHRAFGAGREQTQRANEAILTFAMIETAEGLANVHEIASASGLDGLYVGPADLSLSLGLDTFADLGDPRLSSALDGVVGAATANGIVAGVHAPSPDAVAVAVERGFRFIGAAVDAELLRAAAPDPLRHAREAVERLRR